MRKIHVESGKYTGLKHAQIKLAVRLKLWFEHEAVTARGSVTDSQIHSRVTGRWNWDNRPAHCSSRAITEENRERAAGVTRWGVGGGGMGHIYGHFKWKNIKFSSNKEPLWELWQVAALFLLLLRVNMCRGKSGDDFDVWRNLGFDSIQPRKQNPQQQQVWTIFSAYL